MEENKNMTNALMMTSQDLIQDLRQIIANEIPSEINGVNAVNYSGDKQEVYNISGVKIDKPQTGVNIVNGKKYVSK